MSSSLRRSSRTSKGVPSAFLQEHYKLQGQNNDNNNSNGQQESIGDRRKHFHKGSSSNKGRSSDKSGSPDKGNSPDAESSAKKGEDQSGSPFASRGAPMSSQSLPPPATDHKAHRISLSLLASKIPGLTLHQSSDRSPAHQVAATATAPTPAPTDRNAPSDTDRLLVTQQSSAGNPSVLPPSQEAMCIQQIGLPYSPEFYVPEMDLPHLDDRKHFKKLCMAHGESEQDAEKHSREPAPYESQFDEMYHMIMLGRYLEAQSSKAATKKTQVRVA